jgi:hypothetical protein
MSAATIVWAAPGIGPGRAKLSYRSPRSQTRKMLEQRSG